jgi:hypothetical protein
MLLFCQTLVSREVLAICMIVVEIEFDDGLSCLCEKQDAESSFEVFRALGINFTLDLFSLYGRAVTT